MSAIPPLDWEAPAAITERFTDVGNAKRLVAAHGNRFRYVGAWGQWHVWDGKRWAADTAGQIIEAAKAVAADLCAAAFAMPKATDADVKARKEAIKWALQSESASRIRAMVELARTAPGISATPDEFDANPWALNVANGTVDLRTGTLHPHDPKRMLTKIAPVDYDPNAACPVFDAFLEDILKDHDVREFVARAIGYSITGRISEHKLFMPYGSGANGKSTLLEAIRHVLGDYADQAEPDLLLARRDAHPTGTAKLQGKRFVTTSETNDQRRLDEANVKRLTGGEVLTARFMRQDYFEFTPTHKLWLTTNHRPQVRGTDAGIWRRLRVIPFEVQIPDDKQDRMLDTKLRAEAAGILRWAIDACLRWQRDGLTEPLAVTMATATYRADMDVLGDFLDERCELNDHSVTAAADIYSAYAEWCRESGEESMSQRALGLRLTERGFERVKHGASRRWHWEGLRVRMRAEVNP